MKKAFWIIYAVIFITVVVAGYIMLKDLKKDNEELKLQNEKKKAEIKNIEKAMNQGTLPNKIWPEVYRQRYNIYLDKSQKVFMRLVSYNVRLHQPFSNVQTGLFDMEFKKKWINILKGLLADGFVVSSSAVTLPTIQDQFETGNLAQQLGIPMTWVKGGRVFTPSMEQRSIAEQQYWMQERVIEYFKKAEKGNGDWGAYRYKRKIRTPVEDGSMPAGPHVPSVALISIVFRQNVTDARRGAGYGQRDGKATYVVKKPDYNEYHFSGQFRMRFSSLPAFINSMLMDKDFFFVIDAVDISSISMRGDDKLGRDPKAGFIPETEPPVIIMLRARVLEFHFGRQERAGVDTVSRGPGSAGVPYGSGGRGVQR